MTERKLELILHKDDDNQLAVYACRGAGKGCNRNVYRTTKKPCTDCMGPLPDTMTLEEVERAVKMGGA